MASKEETLNPVDQWIETILEHVCRPSLKSLFYAVGSFSAEEVEKSEIKTHPLAIVPKLLLALSPWTDPWCDDLVDVVLKMCAAQDHSEIFQSTQLRKALPPLHELAAKRQWTLWDRLIAAIPNDDPLNELDSVKNLELSIDNRNISALRTLIDRFPAVDLEGYLVSKNYKWQRDPKEHVVLPLTGTAFALDNDHVLDECIDQMMHIVFTVLLPMYVRSVRAFLTLFMVDSPNQPLISIELLHIIGHYFSSLWDK
jgi:hypothetical protein